MSLSMRVPNVSPASDEHSCREMPLYEWWEKCRRVRKEGGYVFREVTTIPYSFGAIFEVIRSIAYSNLFNHDI